MSDFPQLTRFNKFAITWAVIVCVLTFYKAIIVIVETTGLYINNEAFLHSGYYKNYTQFLVNVIFPFRDCLIAMSLSYLYYYQGTKD